MRILLIDLDSKIPNLALKKVEKFHQDRGDEIIWNMPLAKAIADEIYVSCVFEPTAKIRMEIDRWEGLAHIGGTGYSVSSKLPNEIESVKPRINYGFTTRGCIRKCKFCVVPEKEGYIHIVGDLLDLWDGKSRKITVMDNNILALPEHFALICQQARENKITVDFNQGLDHRLLSQDIVEMMKSISHHEYRMAFDHPSYLPSVAKAIELLRKNKINRACWYVLVGFDTTPEQDLFRLNYLRDNGQRCFVQRYKTHFSEPFYVGLSQWANQPHLFRGKSWQEFLDYPRDDYRRLKLQITQDSSVKLY